MKYLKEALKFILIFIYATLFSFYSSSTFNFIMLCKEKQLTIFEFNGWSNTQNLDQTTINGLGAGTTDLSYLYAKNLIDNNIDVLNIENFSTGSAVWQELQENTFYITHCYEISIFLGLAIAIGYTIIKNKNISIRYKIFFGYLINIIICALIYNFTFSQELKLIRIIIKNPVIIYIFIYTIIYIIMLLSNFLSLKYSNTNTQ